MPDEQQPSVLRDAVIREAVGLTVLAAVLWYMGPGRLIINGLVHKAKTSMGARATHIDTQVAQFRGEVSRWDHEQASQKARRAGGDGPCGCG